MSNLQKIPSSNASAAANVKVVCRFRPLNQRQKILGASFVHELLDQKTVSVKSQQIKSVESKQKDSLRFNFDKVFDSNSKQEQLYNYAASSVVQSVIEGFNGTIFAYGQTSSGKTHTMQGQIVNEITEQSGIIPRMVKHVFDGISKCKENIEFRIKISVVQLYMEKLRDLIDSNKNDLKIRSDKKRGVFIEDLTQSYISSPEEVYRLIDKARKHRSIAATLMNISSSRSHMIFIVTISQNNLDDLSAKTGKLYLVDLAGSEKVGKTGAQGKILDEAKKINTSLAALGNVINALTDGKSSFVPYRNSKLTRVLQQSLGGNSKTTLIVTCSPHPNNISQTLSTLRFGMSAKKIKNCPKINKQLTVAQLQNLLDKAEKQVSQKQKYLSQLKNFILVDLKQKSVPQFQVDKDVQNIEVEQNNLITEIQRQLEMQRNLHIVQESQIQALKIKCDQYLTQKEQLQKEIQIYKINENKWQSKKMEQEKSQATTIIKSSSELNNNQIFNQLLSLTNDPKIIKLFNSISTSNSSVVQSSLSSQSSTLLQQFQQQKNKRIKLEESIIKNQKNLQKKIMQLQNNICQLTHAYFDLVVVQQRYKVDNIFLKKKLQEKDVGIKSLKQKIKDLEDQNRQLQEQWSQNDNLRVLSENRKFMRSVEQSNMKFDEALQKKANIIMNSPQSKVVKVLKGGQK